ncbi:MAG: LysR substrate-binding domain-containing protein [Alphaproteobacteria bacterium]
MTLEKLRIFVEVAYGEHFGRAAERLSISQSAVSGAIATLESRYKVLLFDRSRRRVELTEAGNVLLAEAEAILARADLAERRLEDLAELRIGRLSIAASQTVANYWLPSRLTTFRERYPGLTIDLWDGNSTEVEKRVARDQVDVAIIEQQPNDGSLVAETLTSDTLVVVVGSRHPWFDRETIAWADLPSTTWVMREPGSGTRALFEAALAERGVAPESLPIALTLRTGEAVRNAVAAGTCASVMSTLVAEVAVQTGALRCLWPTAITRHFVVLSRPGRVNTRAAHALLDHLRAGASAERLRDSMRLSPI